MYHILTLEAALVFSERGEEYLKQGNYSSAKECFQNALKCNADFVHLHSILAGIERTMQIHSAAAKMNEAQNCIRNFKYKQASSLLKEALVLNPDKSSVITPLLASLLPLMKSEEAIHRHRLGLTALEEKKYSEAISLITEAMTLLPENSSEFAVFLSDKALVYIESREYSKAMTTCEEALQLQPDLAMAHFRLGLAQFSCDLFDEATNSYEKALKCDASLSEQIKVGNLSLAALATL